MSSVYNDVLSAVADSLSAETLGRCSRWVEKVRIMPDNNPWSFRLYPWLRQIHDDDATELVIMKGAQLGFTEYAINRTLFTLDQLKQNVLYALPNERPDASNFSRGRINGAAELSPYIKNLFALSNNEGQKITKDFRTLYIRGAKSRACFKSVDVALVVLDELDEMSDEAVGLARQRINGQHYYRQLVMLSTPHVAGTGIHRQYEETNQCHFRFPCPSCRRRIEFVYPDCLVITADSLTDPKIADSYLQCPACHNKIDHQQKHVYLAQGRWEPEFPTRPLHGYHVNQLYSSSLGTTPLELAKQEIRGRFNVAEKVEFYNSTLGITYQAEGSQVTDEQIMACKKLRSYTNGDRKEARDHLLTMGIDVGQEHHHVVLTAWQFDPLLSERDMLVSAIGKLVYFTTISSFAEANDLIRLWQPKFIVIDAQPEVKEAVALCKQWQGIARTCYYSLKKVTRDIQTANKNDFSLSVNRTFWLDASLGKIKTQQLALPNDLTQEAESHFKSLIKTYKKDNEDNLVSEYVKKEADPDHYAHALNYSVIALAHVVGKGQNHDSS